MNDRLDAIAQAIDDSAMLRTDARGYARLVTTPGIERVSMVPKPWQVASTITSAAATITCEIGSATKYRASSPGR